MEITLGLVRLHHLLQPVVARVLDMHTGQLQRPLQMELPVEAVAVQPNMDLVAPEDLQLNLFPLMRQINMDSLVEIARPVADILPVQVVVVQVVQVVR
jgi:hypothetical protein